MARWLVYALVFLIPVGTKKFLYSFTSGVSDYHSIFLFGIDAFLVVFLAVWGIRAIKWDGVTKILLGFSFLGLLPVVWSPDPGLVVYKWFHLLLFVLFALAVAALLRKGTIQLNAILWSLVISSVLQSIVGFFQFGAQASVGLRLLGESFITPFTKGVARINVGDLSFLRIYGTMPHANILAAFFIIGLVAAIGLLFLGEKKRWKSALLGFCIFLLLGGLLLTFSRSGWIVAALSVASLLAYGLFSKALRIRALFVSGVILITIASLLIQFGWLVFPRAHFTSEEPSVDHRMRYNTIGTELLLRHPFGVGWGNQILTGAREGLYGEQGLSLSWQEQPIHNLYILIATESGIVGIAAFLIFLFLVFRSAFRRFKEMRGEEGTHEIFICGVLLGGLLLFGLVDHFMWDLEAGQAMLWLTVGLFLGVGLFSGVVGASASQKK